MEIERAKLINIVDNFENMCRKRSSIKDWNLLDAYMDTVNSLERELFAPYKMHSETFITEKLRKSMEEKQYEEIFYSMVAYINGNHSEFLSLEEKEVILYMIGKFRKKCRLYQKFVYQPGEIKLLNSICDICIYNDKNDAKTCKKYAEGKPNDINKDRLCTYLIKNTKNPLISYELVEKIKKLNDGEETSISLLLGDYIVIYSEEDLMGIFDNVRKECREENIILDFSKYENQNVQLSYSTPFIKRKKV